MMGRPLGCPKNRRSMSCRCCRVLRSSSVSFSESTQRYSCFCWKLLLWGTPNALRCSATFELRVMGVYPARSTRSFSSIPPFEMIAFSPKSL